MANTNVKETVKVKGKIMWSFHNRINEMADKYTMDFYDLSENAVEALEEMGISVKHESADDVEEGKTPRNYFITCKSKNPIRVIDEAGERLDDVAIGNGSEAIVTVGFYDWTNPKKKSEKGRSPSARRVRVTDLIVYEGDEDDDEPVL